jgi:hypothetical protein
MEENHDTLRIVDVSNRNSNRVPAGYVPELLLFEAMCEICNTHIFTKSNLILMLQNAVTVPYFSHVLNATISFLMPMKGCAMAHAVSHWIPTAAARVRARVRLCGIRGG